MSNSFPELAEAITEHAYPSRIEVVRAKQYLLGQLGDGLPHPVRDLIAGVSAMFGAEPLAYPQIALRGRDAVAAVVTADHPVTVSIRADLTAREALAELTADGLLIAAGSGVFSGADEISMGYSLPGEAAGLTLRMPPAGCHVGRRTTAAPHAAGRPVGHRTRPPAC